MSGGQNILSGLGLLFLALVMALGYGGAHGIAMIIRGGLPLGAIVAGLVFLWIGWQDRQPKADEPQPGS